MRTPYHPRSRAYLDDVLEGRAHGADPLIDLMQQLQAPPRRRETAGLRTAASAFAWAPSVRPYLPLHHRTGLTSAAAHLWHPKLLVTAATLIAAATIAFATTGNLPTQIAPSSATVGGIAAQLSSQAAVSPNPARSPSDPRRSPPAAPGAAPPGATGSGDATGSSGPSDSSAPTSSAQSGFLIWLCRQWLALPSGSPIAKSPLFKALITEAGGIDSLDLYCNTVVSSGSPSASPGATANSTGGPVPVQTSDPAATPTPTPTS